MIVVAHVAGLATIQDLGRPGRMHEGLAPGGALVPSLLIAANRAVGNADGAPAVEVFGRLRVTAEERIVVGSDAPLDLSAGQELVIESGRRRVAYLALRGGIAAPVICGGRGAQLSAGIGAPLRIGDRVWSARSAMPPSGGVLAEDVPVVIAGLEGGALAPIRVIAGPDRIAGALEALQAAAWRISAASDRVGTRLVGATVPAPAGSGVSRPMVCGAIELPPDGAPIVLGPEHPTTGGYPIVAVIASADLDRFFATPIGGTVRFTAGAAR